jgi:hypothetical protein
MISNVDSSRFRWLAIRNRRVKTETGPSLLHVS